MRLVTTSNLMLGACALAFAAPAFAQTDSAASSSTTSANNGAAVSEVMVTATRRSAPLQTVPVSVDVVSGEQIQAADLKGVRDLQYLSPSVYVTTANGASIAVRGVGTTSTNNGAEQAVGLVVDGVVMGFVDDLGLDDLTDTDQVEVLRGPQGELFGKNASAGVVSINTRNPILGSLSGDVHTSYGELNDTNDSATVNVPIGQDMASRTTVYFAHRDGFVEDVLLHKTDGGQSTGGAREKLLWEPTDKLKVVVDADFRSSLQSSNYLATWKDFGHGYLTYAPGGLDQQQLGIVAGMNNTENADFMTGMRLTRSGGLSTEVNYSFDNGMTLTSVSAFRMLGRHIDAAIVSGAIPFQEQVLNYRGEQYSQELRLTSPSTGKLTYVAGLFGYRRDENFNTLVAGPFGGQAPAVYGPGAEITPAGGRQYVQNVVQSGAVFGEATYHLTDTLRLIAGARYTYDDTRGSTYTEQLPNIYPPLGGVIRPTDALGAHDNNVSYRVGPQYDIAPHVMAYFTASTGYKGPVIDAESLSTPQLVLPETVQAYEGGLKSELLNRKLLLDVAVFNEHFTNFQTSVWEPSINAFRLGNAGGVTSKGVELNFTAKPVSDFTFTGGLTYLQANYTDFKASCYSTVAPIAQVMTSNSSGIGGCYKAPGASSGFVQAAGFPLANASKWTYTLSASYKRQISENFQLDANANYVWRSQFYSVGYDPNTRIPAYGVAGLNIGVGPTNGNWRIAIFARNLFDTYFVAAVASTSTDAGAYTNVISPEARRTVGAMFDKSF